MSLKGSKQHSESIESTSSQWTFHLPGTPKQCHYRLLSDSFSEVFQPVQAHVIVKDQSRLKHLSPRQTALYQDSGGDDTACAFLSLYQHWSRGSQRSMAQRACMRAMVFAH